MAWNLKAANCLYKGDITEKSFPWKFQIEAWSITEFLGCLRGLRDP
jgi:hypothetical protein